MQMNSSTSKFAKAYAAYVSGWLGQSIYDAWFIFFAQIIWKSKSDILDIVGIRDEFNRLYNIRIPIDFVRQTLSLKRDLFSLDRNKVAVVEMAKLEKYIYPEESYVGFWKHLTESFRKYCIQNNVQLDADVDSVVLDCIELYDVDVVAPHADESFEPVNKISYGWNIFVRNLKESDPKQFDFICSLCYGSIAKESILCTEGVRVVFKGLNVYLDSPLVFHLLGMGEAQEQESAECLVDGLLSAGCALWVFRHTLEEVDLIAKSSKRWALDPCNYDPVRASKTARFFRNQNYSAIEIDELICDIEGDLKERFEIKVDKMSYDHISDRFQVDENNLREMFNEKYEYIDEEEKVDKARGIDNDIRSIVMLYRLRAGNRPKNFHQCRHLMVTSSRTMASVCRNFANNDSKSCHIPVCVSSKILASFVWLGNSKKLLNYKRLELLADCSRYLYPSKKILTKFFEKVASNSLENDQARKKYFMLATAPAFDQVLMATIKGDEENITDNTVEEVCERLRTDVISQHLVKDQRDKQLQKYEYKKRRNAKILKYVPPLANLLIVVSFLLLNGLGAALTYTVKEFTEESTVVGFIILAIIDSFCIGGIIHEKWGVRLSRRIAIRFIRSIFGFFQY